jgi:hypothetical protein
LKNHPLDVALAIVIFLGAHLLGLLIDITASAPVAPAPAPAPVAAPAPKPAIRAVITLQPLTVDQLIAKHTQRELMAMAGTKSKRSKKQLAEKILQKYNLIN